MVFVIRYPPAECNPLVSDDEPSPTPGRFLSRIIITFDLSHRPSLNGNGPWREIFSKVAELGYDITVDIMMPAWFDLGDRAMAALRKFYKMEHITIVVHQRPPYFDFGKHEKQAEKEYLTNHIASFIE